MTEELKVERLLKLLVIVKKLTAVLKITSILLSCLALSIEQFDRKAFCVTQITTEYRAKVAG